MKYRRPRCYEHPSSGRISLSGADPLNLIGVLTPGPRLAALTDNRLVYRDGIPVATLSAGKVQFLTTLDAKSQWEAEKRLVRSAARGLLAHLSSNRFRPDDGLSQGYLRPRSRAA